MSLKGYKEKKLLIKSSVKSCPFGRVGSSFDFLKCFIKVFSEVKNVFKFFKFQKFKSCFEVYNFFNSFFKLFEKFQSFQ